METGTIFVLLFVVATAVAIAVQRLAVPYTVALVFTGSVLGLLHAFETPHLTQALLFNVFLPRGAALRSCVLHRVQTILAKPIHN
jgi:disulfide bond formation protein DsbB